MIALHIHYKDAKASVTEKMSVDDFNIATISTKKKMLYSIGIKTCQLRSFFIELISWPVWPMQWRVCASLWARAVRATVTRRCLCCDRRDYSRRTPGTRVLFCPKHAHGGITETRIFLLTMEWISAYSFYMCMFFILVK